MPQARTKRSEQLPRLKAAAMALAKDKGETKVVSNLSVIEVRLATLYFWLTPFGPFVNLDVWDETTGGNKVLNICWGRDAAIETTSFRRGNWEDVLLRHARMQLH